MTHLEKNYFTSLNFKYKIDLTFRQLKFFFLLYDSLTKVTHNWLRADSFKLLLDFCLKKPIFHYLKAFFFYGTIGQKILLRD